MMNYFQIYRTDRNCTLLQYVLCVYWLVQQIVDIDVNNWIAIHIIMDNNIKLVYIYIYILNIGSILNCMFYSDSIMMSFNLIHDLLDDQHHI